MKPKEPDFIAIGRILAPWGSKGQLKVEVLTDFPQRFNAASEIYVNRQPTTINGTTWQKGKAIIQLASIDSTEKAAKLRGQLIEIPANLVEPLPQNHYYHFQLIGLTVKTSQGEPLGQISEVLTTGSNDVYVVKGDKGEILIPAVGDVVKSVDLDKGWLIIEAIDGLINQ